MLAPLIHLENVSVVRGEALVLRDISLRVAAGEHIAILGPNGCGKSTLLKVLTCELYPIPRPGTQVKLFGRERWDVTELRRRLGVVSADPPSPTMLRNTGLEAVLTGFFSSSTLWPHLHVTPTLRRLGEETLARVGASHLAGKPLPAMSAGEQRRIFIARALVGTLAHAQNEPQEATSGPLSHQGQVLLLDEPSNALDLAAQQTLRELLRSLARSGTTLLLITHNIADIFPEIREVLLLQHGRIFRHGPRELLLTPSLLSELFGVPVAVTERSGILSAS